jgi:hypothetical protein
MPAPIPQPPLAEKMGAAADKDARQWSGEPTEAIATPPRHEHDSMITTWDKTARVRKGKVKTMTGPQDEDQDTQGGT